jgi:hypothetical protein
MDISGRYLQVLVVELIFSFTQVRIERDAVNRAYLLALRRIEMAYALGTQARVNHINFIALRNGAVGALGLTHVAVDALIGNH